MPRILFKKVDDVQIGLIDHDVLKDFAEIREMIDCLDNGQVSASTLRQTANNLELLVLNMSHRIKTLCDENYELETAKEILECELKKVKGE